MGLATANGTPVLRARITMQRLGCWVADFLVSDPIPTGKVTLAIDGGLTLVGTTRRGGDWLETSYMRLLPGAAGMGLPARPKHYQNGSVGVVSKDLLAAGGEVLAASSDRKLMSVQMPAYTQARDEVGRCLTALLQDRRLSAPVWRALPDGTIWIGYETWPDSGLVAPDAFQRINALPHEGKMDLGFDSPLLLPGQSLEGLHVSAVVHEVEGGRVRTTAWFED